MDFNAQFAVWQQSGYLSKFTELASAESACENATQPLRIVLGDDDQHWVTTPRIAAELERLGYQIA